MGSKSRFADVLMPIMLKSRKPNQWYVEPFCGGCNVIDKVSGNRLANDINAYVIAMWQSLVYEQWIPPTTVTEAEYTDIKKNQDKYPKNLVGFVGCLLTFGSKWFDTYARNSRGTNYAMEGRKNLLQQAKNLYGTVFKSVPYNQLELPANSIVYCDPPYQGTSKYKDTINHTDFWQWVRDTNNRGHAVFVSEYNAPKDFVCIWQSKIVCGLNSNHKTNTTEKLFVYSQLSLPFPTKE